MFYVFHVLCSCGDRPNRSLTWQTTSPWRDSFRQRISHQPYGTHVTSCCNVVSQQHTSQDAWIQPQTFFPDLIWPQRKSPTFVTRRHWNRPIEVHIQSINVTEEVHVCFLSDDDIETEEQIWEKKQRTKKNFFWKRHNINTRRRNKWQ